MKYLCFILSFFACSVAAAQGYTRQDTLRGSNGRGRSWWDVQRYDLIVEFDTFQNAIRGANSISMLINALPIDSMQIDLQDAMVLDSVRWKGKHLDFAREGNVYWVKFGFSDWRLGSKQTVILNYHGIIKTAKHAPWDGGLISTKDSMGNKWLAMACQGLGASSWWPCKDYQGDEPEQGMSTYIDYPNQFVISNGKSGINLGGHAALHGIQIIDDDTGSLTTVFKTRSSVPSYDVKNPINTYSTTFYIGNYAHWQDTFHGEKGTLNLDFYPLKYNEAKARKQWAVTKEMLRCYEYWLGPYPFYEDGYKLVEAPYLGMEHQSAIAYGNGYEMGYRGRDLSGTGVGKLFDYIIIHESGHEWFGNNITAQDIADNWLHEGFTTYTETLFAEWITNRKEAFKYAAGEWEHIANDYPVIGDYGVNDDKGSDKYYKGAAVVHMVRMMLRDDERFRQLLRGLNKDFYHQIVTSAQVEAYISKYVGTNLKPFFDQYLRTRNEPVLTWYLEKGQLHYRWDNAVPGFDAPFVLKNGKEETLVTGSDKQFKSQAFKKRKIEIEACGWYAVRNETF